LLNNNYSYVISDNTILKINFLFHDALLITKSMATEIILTN